MSIIQEERELKIRELEAKIAIIKSEKYTKPLLDGLEQIKTVVKFMKPKED